MKTLLLSTVLVASVSLGRTQHLSSVIHETWNNSSWDSTSTESYTYNPDSTVAFSQTETHVSPQVWDHSDKTVFTYDTDGRVILELTSSWDQSGGWQDSKKSVSAYDPVSGKVLTITDQLMVSGAWQNTKLQTMTYNADGNNTLTVTQNWNTSGNAWVNADKLEYVYNLEDKAVTMTYYSWNTGTSAWVRANLSTYVYNSAGNLMRTEIQKWLNNVWKNERLLVNVYNESGQLISAKHATWNAAVNDWDLVSREDFTYYENGNVHQGIFQAHSTNAEAWENESRTTYLYMPDMLGTEENLLSDFKVYPNPAADFVTVSFDQLTEAAVSLTDLHGKALYSEAVSGQLCTVSVSGLPAGIYLLKIANGGQEAVTRIVRE